MNRQALAALVLALLAGTAGCGALTGGDIDRSKLDDEATYDWDVDANATYDVPGDGQYRAVLRVQNRSEIQVYGHSQLEGDTPVSVAAVKFRYPNGTVVNASAMTIEVNSGRTVIEPPARHGKLAYSAPSAPKQFGAPVAVDGTHEVTLPPNMRVSAFLFGYVQPGGAETTLRDDRVTIRWDDLDDGSISVRYYLARDFYIFAGFVALLLLVGVVGVVRYRLQIRRLEREREESDIDMER